MAIHSLQKLGENSSGAKAGVELPRDDLRLEGVMNDDGELVERPNVEIVRISDGEWRIKRLSGEDIPSQSD